MVPFSLSFLFVLFLTSDDVTVKFTIFIFIF